MGKKALSKPPVLTSGITNLPQPPSKKAEDYLLAYRSWVYSAVKLVSQAVAGIDLKLYKKKIVRGKVETEEVVEHPSLSLLAHANNFTTRFQLLELTETYLELMGEAFWAVIRDNGVLTEVYSLRPDWVKVKADKGEIQGYIYRPWGGSDEVNLQPEDVIPFRTINPLNPYRGRGAVQAAAMAFDINDYSASWQRAFFYNSAMPSLVFTTDQKFGEAELTRFVKAWEAKFQGTKKAHQIAAVGGGLEPHILTGKLSEMQLLELQEWVRDEVLSCFGVSKANLGITKEVNRATQEATDARLIKQVVKPKMVSLATQLTEFLLPLYPNTENMFFDFVDPVPPDQEMDLKYYESGMQHHWLTINEVRERENRPPVQGGDIIYLPFNLQPLGGVLEKVKGFFGKKVDEEVGLLTLPVEKRKETVKHNVPLPVKRIKEIRQELEDKEIKDGVKSDLVQLITKVMAQKEAPLSEREVFWKELIARTDIWEIQMRGIVGELFKEQREEVLGKITGAKSLKKFRKAVEEFLFSSEGANKKWLERILPFLKGIIGARSQQVFRELGIEMELNVESDPVAEFLRKQAGELIKGINDYTRERLQITLAEGVDLGEGVPKLTERVKDVFDIATTSRAKTIARTEVLRASNFSTLQSYKESGVVEGKEWITALDERTHPGCVDVDGDIVPVDGQFETEVGPLDAPPMHPNCRCTIGATFEKPKGMQEEGVRKLKLDEAEMEIKLAQVEAKLRAKYKELEEEIPELKGELVDEMKADIIEEKNKIIAEAKDEKAKIMGELSDLRSRALEVANE